MTKIVLDTNVLISALIRTGKPRALILEIVEGKAQLILSRDILEEFAKTTANPKIRRYIDLQDTTEFLKIIGSLAKIVRIKSKFKVVNQDPDDDIILRPAYDGKADYIVSGDEHLLTLKTFKGIKIVNIAAMLEILKYEYRQPCARKLRHDRAQLPGVRKGARDKQRSNKPRRLAIF